MFILGADFEQGIHETILKEPIKLGEVGFFQCRDKHRKTGRTMDEQYALATLQQDQIGVPTAQGIGYGITSGEELRLATA